MLLFGFNGKSKHKYALNFMLTLARNAIWRRRNIMKQNKFIKITLLYKQILEEIKVLYDHCKMVENMELFEKKIITKNESLYCENLVWFCKSVTK